MRVGWVGGRSSPLEPPSEQRLDQALPTLRPFTARGPLSPWRTNFLVGWGVFRSLRPLVNIPEISFYLTVGTRLSPACPLCSWDLGEGEHGCPRPAPGPRSRRGHQGLSAEGRSAGSSEPARFHPLHFIFQQF